MVSWTVDARGVVSLAGCVDSPPEKRRLIEGVKVNGVTEVRADDLKIDTRLQGAMERPREPVRLSDE